MERHINEESKEIAVKLEVNSRVNRLVKLHEFIKLKDHKDNFLRKPVYRLLNSMKYQLERINKFILEITCRVMSVRLLLNQLKTTKAGSVTSLISKVLNL